MIDEVANQGTQILFQYGAIGVMLLFSMYKEMVLAKDLKDAINNQSKILNKLGVAVAKCPVKT